MQRSIPHCWYSPEAVFVFSIVIVLKQIRLEGVE